MGDSCELKTDNFKDVIKMLCKYVVANNECSELMHAIDLNENCIMKMGSQKYAEMVETLNKLVSIERELQEYVGGFYAKRKSAVCSKLLNMSKHFVENWMDNEFRHKGIIRQNRMGEYEMHMGVRIGYLPLKSSNCDVLSMCYELQSLLQSFYKIIENACLDQDGSNAELETSSRAILCQVISCNIRDLEDRSKCARILDENVAEIGAAIYVQLKSALNMFGWITENEYYNVLKSVLAAVEETERANGKEVFDYKEMQNIVVELYSMDLNDERDEILCGLVKFGQLIKLNSFLELMEKFWCTKIRDDKRAHQFLHKFEQTIIEVMQMHSTKRVNKTNGKRS